MSYTRREFGKLAVGMVPAATFFQSRSGAIAPKPNSVINGVNIGTITYSYRSMPDQSAEAMLRYVVDSGISQIEFMGAAVEAFAGAPAMSRGGGGGGRRGGGPPTDEQRAAQRDAEAKLR